MKKCDDGLESQLHFFFSCSKYSEPIACLMAELTIAVFTFMMIAPGNVNDDQC